MSWICIIASLAQSERTITIAAHKRFEPVTSVAPLLLIAQFVCWNQWEVTTITLNMNPDTKTVKDFKSKFVNVGILYLDED